MRESEKWFSILEKLFSALFKFYFKDTNMKDNMGIYIKYNGGGFDFNVHEVMIILSY